ncbi:hypothetical protein [Hymenobacter sp. B1770]|uniref:hypothetical protein n=1 Tax=Hymenobacter sp. B1770 TaxID=1718788 RepID=UPI003CEB9494
MSHSDNSKAFKWIIIVSSMALFAISLTQYAYCTEADQNGECTQAVSVLLVGWLGIVGGGVALTWFANPFLLLSWMLALNFTKFAVLTSGFALLLMLSFLAFREVMVNEAGGYSKIAETCSGYWLWIASALVMLVGNLIVMRKETNRAAATI